jgi:hypothetical protein
MDAQLREATRRLAASWSVPKSSPSVKTWLTDAPTIAMVEARAEAVTGAFWALPG